MDRTILISVAELSHGGLETRLADDIKFLRARGDRVVLATGADAGAVARLDLSADAALYKIPFNRAMSVERLTDIIGQLAALIEQERVDEVWAHPFPSILPSVLAAEVCARPRRVFLHGPLSLANSGYGNLMGALLKQFVLPAAEEVVCVSEETRAAAVSAAFGPMARICVVANGVDGGVFAGPAPGFPLRRRILAVSRLDKPRVRALLGLLGALRGHGWSIDFAGDGAYRRVLERAVRLYGYDAGQVRFLGVRNDIADLHPEYDVVAANGRAFLEAASANKVCILAGPDAPPLLVTVDSFGALASNNYSGRGAQPSEVGLAAALEDFDPAEAGRFRLREQVEQIADQQKILESWQAPPLTFRPSALAGLLKLLSDETVARDVAIRDHPVILRRIKELDWSPDGRLAFQAAYIDFLETSRASLNQRLWSAEYRLKQLQSTG
ncbi:MAG: glycosyltransferase [Hyphomonas sp.]